MYYNTEATIYDYKQKIDEYRETLGILPTDVPELLTRIIIDPQTSSEMELSQRCFNFIEHHTSLFSDTDRELQNDRTKCTAWREYTKNINGILHGILSNFEEAKKHYQDFAQNFPEVVEKMRKTIEEVILKTLTEPKTADDSLLCQSYRNYLFIQVKFAQKKEEYMGELEKRESIITAIKESGTHQQLLEILLDPKNDEELKFCISYFRLQDSIQTIKDEATDGKSKPSSTADLVRVVSPNLYTPENYIDEQSSHTLADLLYSMVIAEQADYENLITSLAANYYPLATIEKIISKYQSFVEYGQNSIIQGISRENPNQNDSMQRFCEIQEEFSRLTKKGNVYKPETINKPKTNPQKKLPSWHIYG